VRTERGDGLAPSASRDQLLVRDARLLRAKRGQLRAERRELCTRLRQPRIERIEVHQRRVRAVSEHRLLTVERVGRLRGVRTSRSGEREGQDEAHSDDKGRRAARLPSATHGPGR